MGAHSPLAPSSASRWVACPGSVWLGGKFPELGDTSRADEGTAAHWVGAEILLGTSQPQPGTVAPNGYIVDEDMLDGATIWVEDVLAVAGDRRAELQVEQRVAMPRIHPEAFGTPDTWLYDQAHGVLYVWDFKYGHGIVEVAENWQMIAYVCGILDLLGVDGRTDQHVTVDMRIVQPRAYHRAGRVRSWRVKASDLRGHFNQLHAAAHDAMQPGARLAAGPHCMYCPAARGCPTLRRNILAIADWAEGAQPEQLPPDALGAELVLLELLEKLVKARHTAIETQVEATLRAGQPVGDWTLEPAYGRQKWTKPADEVAALGDLFGVDLRKPLDVITPNQASKKGVDAAVIKSYSEYPSAGMKLVRDTNLTNKARAAFGANRNG
jgi:hypothetical protein